MQWVLLTFPVDPHTPVDCSSHSLTGPERAPVEDPDRIQLTTTVMQSTHPCLKTGHETFLSEGVLPQS